MAGVLTPEQAATVSKNGEQEATGRSDRWTRAAGLAFVALFFVGVPLVTWTWDDQNADSEILSWYADSGHRAQQAIGVFVVALAGLALLRFCVGLRARLHRDDASDGQAATTMVAAGAVFTALLFVGAAAIAAVSAGIEFGDNPLPTDADVIRGLEAIGFGSLLGFGGFAAALCVLTASLAARQRHQFPKWLEIVGYGVAVLLLLSIIYLPMALFPVWVGLVSVWGLRRTAAA